MVVFFVAGTFKLPKLDDFSWRICAEGPGYNPATQQNPTEAAPPTSSSASAAAATAQMSPVNGELVNKLDSKTAKSGDSVVVQTKRGPRLRTEPRYPKDQRL